MLVELAQGGDDIRDEGSTERVQLFRTIELRRVSEGMMSGVYPRGLNVRYLDDADFALDLELDVIVL